ncbi:unnamed protein product [Brachionus calyciflorus]|uniref:Uncharacterized protein n=1 Tax=Brachionus calyciflorus TaxID=104777 RepID=A0A814KKI0_9BILA|nr:unnamed protein product [Brachionus calyciflorus]
MESFNEQNLLTLKNELSSAKEALKWLKESSLFHPPELDVNGLITLGKILHEIREEHKSESANLIIESACQFSLKKELKIETAISELSGSNYEKLSEQFEKLEKIVDQNHMLQLEKESVRTKIDLSNQDAIIKAIREVSAENKVLFSSMASAVYHIAKYDNTDPKDYILEANKLISDSKPIFISVENNSIKIEFYKLLNETTVSSCFVLVKDDQIFLLTYIPIKTISNKELQESD